VYTVLSYALHAHVLRKFVGAETATEQEKKLLAKPGCVSKNWKKLGQRGVGLFYDSNARKKKESWGTGKHSQLGHPRIR